MSGQIVYSKIDNSFIAIYSTNGLKIVNIVIIRLVIMFGAMFLVMIKGTIDIGGIGNVWEKAVDSGRIELPE